MEWRSTRVSKAVSNVCGEIYLRDLRRKLCVYSWLPSGEDAKNIRCMGESSNRVSDLSLMVTIDTVLFSGLAYLASSARVSRCKMSCTLNESFPSDWHFAFIDIADIESPHGMVSSSV